MRKRDYGLEDDQPDDGPALGDGPPNPPRDSTGRLIPTRCTCNSRSEEPCGYCCREGDDP